MLAGLCLLATITGTALFANGSAEPPPPPRTQLCRDHQTDPRSLAKHADSLRAAHNHVDLQVVGLESLQRESTADQWYGRQGGDINDRVHTSCRRQPLLLLDAISYSSWLSRVLAIIHLRVNHHAHERAGAAGGEAGC